MSRDQGRKPHQADYGLGEATIDADSLGLMDEAELTELLVRTFESPKYSPPRLPAVATELLALSRDPDVAFEKIESLLERDAVLAGEVLSLARSAFYAGSAKVTSLRDALTRVGLQRLREVVMQAAMSVRVFRSTAYKGCMERLREHSRVTAHLCRFVSRHAPMDEEQAFLCGLLHDVGIAGILLVLGDTERGKRAPDLTPLWPAIHAAHGRAGASIVKLWGLPADVILAVAVHHQVRVKEYDHPLASCVCLAESLAFDLDLGLTPSSAGGEAQAELESSGLLVHVGIDRSDGVTLARARAALGVSEAALDGVRREAAAWLKLEAARKGA